MTIRWVNLQWAVLIVLIFGMIYAALPWQIAAVMFLGFFTLVAWTSISRAIIMLAFVNPFLNLIRNVGPESMLLAGWREVVIVILLFFTLLRFREVRVPRQYREDFVIIALLVYYLAIHILLAQNMYIGFLGFRENAVILLLIPLILLHFKEGDGNMIRLMVVLLIGGSMVASIDIIQYYMPTDLLPQNIAEDMSQRQLFGQDVFRLVGYFGVGPSGVASYYTTLAAMGLLLTRIPHIDFRVKMIGLSAFLLTLFASLLTISMTTYSTLLMTGFALLYLNLSFEKVKSSFPFVLAFVLGSLTFLKMMEIFDIIDMVTSIVIRYRAEFFTLITWPDNLLDWLVGLKYSIRTGRLLGDVGGSGTLVVDTGWFGILAQFGFIGAILYVGIIGLGIRTLHHLKQAHASTRSMISSYSLTAIVWLATFGYVHGAPISQRPIDLLFVSMFALMRMQSRGLNVSKSTTP